jgi:hypothetical protein
MPLKQHQVDVIEDSLRNKYSARSDGYDTLPQIILSSKTNQVDTYICTYSIEVCHFGRPHISPDRQQIKPPDVSSSTYVFGLNDFTNREETP